MHATPLSSDQWLKRLPGLRAAAAVSAGAEPAAAICPAAARGAAPQHSVAWQLRYNRRSSAPPGAAGGQRRAGPDASPPHPPSRGPALGSAGALAAPAPAAAQPAAPPDDGRWALAPRPPREGSRPATGASSGGGARLRSARPDDVLPVLRQCLRAIAQHQSWYGPLWSFLLAEYEGILAAPAGSDEKAGAGERRGPLTPPATPEPDVQSTTGSRLMGMSGAVNNLDSALVCREPTATSGAFPGGVPRSPRANALGNVAALRDHVQTLEDELQRVQHREREAAADAVRLRQALRQRQARTAELERELQEQTDRAMKLQAEVHRLSQQVDELKRADEEEQGTVRRELEAKLRAATASCDEAAARLSDQAEAREEAERRVDTLQEHLRKIALEVADLRRNGRQEDQLLIEALREELAVEQIDRQNLQLLLDHQLDVGSDADDSTVAPSSPCGGKSAKKAKSGFGKKKKSGGKKGGKKGKKAEQG
eukprot:TRINITY_DN7607_c0_g1_i1.p1 TRINITY_DN7607_c0_g1~~TRINITY_DN7607_c0_g1_i1.p1  ORF type:complete len:509 (+),score=157.64 TRINITY_DN7607_c0_g1_i1:82-1527(+)